MNRVIVVLWLGSCNVEGACLTLKTTGHDLFRGSLGGPSTALRLNSGMRFPIQCAALIWQVSWGPFLFRGSLALEPLATVSSGSLRQPIL